MGSDSDSDEPGPRVGRRTGRVVQVEDKPQGKRPAKKLTALLASDRERLTSHTVVSELAQRCKMDESALDATWVRQRMVAWDKEHKPASSSDEEEVELQAPASAERKRLKKAGACGGAENGKSGALTPHPPLGVAPPTP